MHFSISVGIHFHEINAMFLAYSTTSVITSSNMAGNKNKKQKRIAKKQILKKGLQDWMAETALHGLKYLSSGTSILAKIVWVII